MSSIPRFLEYYLSRAVTKRQAKEVYEWLQSNSTTVVADDLENAIHQRRDWPQEKVVDK